MVYKILKLILYTKISNFKLIYREINTIKKSKTNPGTEFYIFFRKSEITLANILNFF
jgi:hypothetical protein